jgi:hypothetical protein
VNSLSGSTVRGPFRESGGSPYHFIGGRRLGAWEAVVFGEPHVENALATENEVGLSILSSVVTEVSVAMLIRFECVPITPHPIHGSFIFHL